MYNETFFYKKKDAIPAILVKEPPRRPENVTAKMLLPLSCHGSVFRERDENDETYLCSQLQPHEADRRLLAGLQARAISMSESDDV